MKPTKEELEFSKAFVADLGDFVKGVFEKGFLMDLDKDQIRKIIKMSFETIVKNMK